MRESFSLKNTNKASASDDASMIHKSPLKKRGAMSIGPKKLAMPMMASRLNMLDPITFPNATSA